jgi:hypothetical protein
MSSKLKNIKLRKIGQLYLFDVLEPVISELINSNIDLEIDPQYFKH